MICPRRTDHISYRSHRYFARVSINCMIYRSRRSCRPACVLWLGSLIICLGKPATASTDATVSVILMTIVWGNQLRLLVLIIIRMQAVCAGLRCPEIRGRTVSFLFLFRIEVGGHNNSGSNNFGGMYCPCIYDLGKGRCGTLLLYNVVLHGMVWYTMLRTINNTTQRGWGTVWYYMVRAWYGTVWCCMVWYGFARYGAVLYGTRQFRNSSARYNIVPYGRIPGVDCSTGTERLVLIAPRRRTLFNGAVHGWSAVVHGFGGGSAIGLTLGLSVVDLFWFWLI